MKVISLLISIWLGQLISLTADKVMTSKMQIQDKPWIVNIPQDWNEFVHLRRRGEKHHKSPLTDAENTTIFEKFISDQFSAPADFACDGENVDAIEHFFRGKTNGVALELGAISGGRSAHSMTYDLEDFFSWRRILIEGNPTQREAMIRDSPRAYSVNSAICKQKGDVHYVSRPDLAAVSGIMEFVAPDFVNLFHGSIYFAGVPPGNISSVDWTKFPTVQRVDCLPLTSVLHHAGLFHINFFILDTEGVELEVLRSVDFSRIRFDVISVETDPVVRPKGYADAVTALLSEVGYKDVSGQQARNIWYIHKDFQPSKRPGIPDNCYNGVHRVSKKSLCYV